MVGDTIGTVEDLSLRVTRLRGNDGSMWFVPNGEIRKLANRHPGMGPGLRSTRWSRPAADVDTVLDAARAAAPSARRRIPPSPTSCSAPPEVLGIVAADVETLTARVSVRVPSGRREAADRALRVAVARRLRDAGVFARTSAGPGGAGG